MAKVIGQEVNIADYTILYLDVNWFEKKLNFTQVEIAGERYKVEICTCIHRAIGIKAIGSFVVKEVNFI